MAFAVDTQKLRAAFVERGLTQTEVARMIGVNVSTLNRKLNNNCGDKITLGEARAIAEKLHIEHPERIFFARQSQ